MEKWVNFTDEELQNISNVFWIAADEGFEVDSDLLQSLDEEIVRRKEKNGVILE